MKSRPSNSRFIETLEGRSMMSTVVTGDLNHDGRLDKVEVTNATTITVSLQQLNGTYSVSAILTTPKNRPVGPILEVRDLDNDGDLDINTVGDNNAGGFYVHRWLNNGDGTFGSITTEIFRFKKTRGGTW